MDGRGSIAPAVSSGLMTAKNDARQVDDGTGGADPKYAELRRRLVEVSDIGAASAVLSWDQTTYMPPGGSGARGRQLATLGRLAHERFTDDAIGHLLDDLRPYEESLSPQSDEASLIRVTRRDYEKAVRVPASFVAEDRAHGAASYDAWVAARPANDFRAVQPFLEKTLDLSLQYAGFFPGYAHVADPLIDDSDPGVTAAEVRRVFDELRGHLVPLVRAITGQLVADDACLRQHYPEQAQWAAGVEAIRLFGYDFERGRQDKSAHPYTTRFAHGDVRITTRVNEHDLRECLFATLHEAGHGLYEQGVAPPLDATPLGSGASSGVHESQSRLWENRVGRSRGFWTFFYPRLQSHFPAQLGSVPLDTFYRAINKVERSLIRVEADEVTYNLHIMIRFGLELDLLEGGLAVKDLPEAWNERYRSDLGITPPDDRDGVLQDVHWYTGRIGGLFQGYTLGNILGAQFFDAAVAEQPDIPAQIERGELNSLLTWLQERLYRHGRKLTTPELVEGITGGPLRSEPLVRYLTRKYGELYELG
ncbi:MAG: Thermostable carboxypeptidase 1 [uncultured Chloroflexi bacterium]|uniref:Metal-dependent carboxypeptidase n=1 Tax=uncultured Chloroflexota bacterium TaxID=166587 RepID=A0A6J4K7A1_9CHLR|nr:MAG: Thermostable carboxypeptidase 1 [uncultured Chloroflexota bacterium]